MNLKCVKCEKDAEYLVSGTSYCKEHKPKPTKQEPMPIVPSMGMSGLSV